MDSRISSLAAFALVAITIAACRTERAPASYAPPPVCGDGPPLCSVDRRTVVQCQRGQWVTLEPCPGPGGCVAAPNGAMQSCDRNTSQNPSPARPPVPPAPPSTGNGVGIACAGEGGYDCTPDRRGLTICRGGRTVLASTCRGTRGCSIAAAIDCDHSIATVGDACDNAKDIACSSDARQVLRCNGATYQFSETCPNACLATGGRVLCQ